VSSPEDLSKIVAGEGSKRGAVMLQINRRGENIFRAVPVSSGK
jgi:serine protease Do